MYVFTSRRRNTRWPREWSSDVCSSDLNAPTIIKALRLEHYFQVIVDPTKVEQGKPAPDIFLLAASQLGITPKKCIGIEIGRASCRERVQIVVGGGQMNEKVKRKGNRTR